MSSLAFQASSVGAATGLSIRCSAQPAGPSSSVISRVGLSGSPAAGLAWKGDRAAAAAEPWASMPLSFAPSPAPIPDASVDPSAGFANIMWAAGASKTFNTQILVGETESTESVVRRFKKVCLEANIVQECRRRRYFETKQDITKRKQKDAARKRKRFQRSGAPRPNFYANKDKAEQDKTADAQEDDDEAEWNAMVI